MEKRNYRLNIEKEILERILTEAFLLENAIEYEWQSYNDLIILVFLKSDQSLNYFYTMDEIGDKYKITGFGQKSVKKQLIELLNVLRYDIKENA